MKRSAEKWSPASSLGEKGRIGRNQQQLLSRESNGLRSRFETGNDRIFRHGVSARAVLVVHRLAKMKVLFALGLFVAVTIPLGLCSTSLGPHLNVKTRKVLVEEIEPPNLEALVIGHKIANTDGRIFAKVEVAKLVEEKLNVEALAEVKAKVNELKNMLENKNMNEIELIEVNEIESEIVTEEVEKYPNISERALKEVIAHPDMGPKAIALVNALVHQDMLEIVEQIAGQIEDEEVKAEVIAHVDMKKLEEVKAEVQAEAIAKPDATAEEIVFANPVATALVLEIVSVHPYLGAEVFEIVKEIVFENLDIKKEVQAKVNAQPDLPTLVQANSLEYSLVDKNGSKHVLVLVEALVDAKTNTNMKELVLVKELENVLANTLVLDEEEEVAELQSSGLTGGSRYIAGMTGVTVISVILVILVIAGLNWQSQRRKSGYFADARILQKQREM